MLLDAFLGQVMSLPFLTNSFVLFFGFFLLHLLDLLPFAAIDDLPLWGM